MSNRVSSDTVEGCRNGDATERRSAYAKASAYAEASACALYATADKTVRQVGGSSALLEYAVMHDDEAEAARLRAELCRLVEKV